MFRRQQTGNGKWQPKGGEIVATSMLIEIDEIEPPDMILPPVGPADIKIIQLIAAGALGSEVRGEINNETITTLQELGRLKLAAEGIDFNFFEAQYNVSQS